jgi:hypothetical protein
MTKMNRQLATIIPAVALAFLPGEPAAQTPKIVDIALPDIATSTAIQQVDLSQLPMSDGLFGGTWDSSFGQLKLIQTDNVVIGDYGSVGILFGEVVTSDCIAGVFTNGDQYGQFSFRISEAGRFSGVYRFGETGAGQSWDGIQTSALIPGTFANFNTDKVDMPHISNNNATLNGMWQSEHGDLRLRHADLFLFGDYADRGVIAARWDGTQFQGIFTNSSLAQGNQVGWATFGADILAGKITDGTWQLQSGSGGSWKVLDRSGTGSDFTNIVPVGACQPLWPF